MSGTEISVARATRLQEILGEVHLSVTRSRTRPMYAMGTIDTIARLIMRIVRLGHTFFRPAEDLVRATSRKEQIDTKSVEPTPPVPQTMQRLPSLPRENTLLMPSAKTKLSTSICPCSFSMPSRLYFHPFLQILPAEILSSSHSLLRDIHFSYFDVRADIEDRFQVVTCGEQDLLPPTVHKFSNTTHQYISTPFIRYMPTENDEFPLNYLSPKPSSLKLPKI
ncbi:uncharacterized protein BDR25DRAFT_348990 [Lindgomyces ingoldianus]|uniref:Uncharacterized protein n=1 Tax=Lindgomyces ingoldianus TaxID=673940 RepID=A0ACB6RCY5_9PLEO|nr:uncharacterized protein BDR25DRAFT_348990 [Lindgomyces ingoldianus]KAF2477104.1 hypothetical protein BDR25DRAFT_348990 [Lindgomyces ingoldianus]